MEAKTVRVVPHDPTWAAQFDVEQSCLVALLPDCICNVHHIGSTSVPDLAATPIIDILLEGRSLEVLDANASKLGKFGYVAHGEYGLPRRRFFTKGGVTRTHHVQNDFVNRAEIAALKWHAGQRQRNY
ncbi:MAG: GrpB family protein [Betaproteobacteria bacterium]